MMACIWATCTRCKPGNIGCKKKMCYEMEENIFFSFNKFFRLVKHVKKLEKRVILRIGVRIGLISDYVCKRTEKFCAQFVAKVAHMGRKIVLCKITKRFFVTPQNDKSFCWAVKISEKYHYYVF